MRARVRLRRMSFACFACLRRGMYNVCLLVILRNVLNSATLRDRMPRSTYGFAFRLTLSLALILGTFLVFAQTQPGGSKPVRHPAKQVTTSTAASVQTFRTVGTA